LSFADLGGADLTDAVIGSTDFSGADLSGAIGLDTCLFRGPSVVDRGAPKKSGMLPINFLRGCGLPDSLIDLATCNLLEGLVAGDGFEPPTFGL